MQVEFYGFNFNLPIDWLDITEELPEGSPPTLARSAGAGVVQFSSAKYKSGEKPDVTSDILMQFINTFFIENNIRCKEFIECDGDILSVMGTAEFNDELIIVRYYSNGTDIVIVTYTCTDTQNPELKKDLAEVKIIMDTLEF